ncbi:AfsR/SARP family transcriptional regulator [Streptomyces sp. NPDC055400]
MKQRNGATLTISVLGPLQVTVDGTSHLPRGPKAGRLLALLALRPGRAVHTDELIDELWDESPPAAAPGILHTHVYNLRRQLDRILGTTAASGERSLATTANGYLLRVPAQAVDAWCFGSLVDHARRQLGAGRPDIAREDARLALSMWRGRPLAGLATGRSLLAEVARLEELRIQALRVRVEAQLGDGAHADAVPQLRALVAAHPLDEWFHTRLVEALWLSGRRSSALEAVHHVRRLLADELGLGLSPELEALHSAVLGASSRTPTARLAPA